MTAVQHTDLQDLSEQTFDSFGYHVAVSLTNRCPLSCAHCVTQSGPKVSAPDLSAEAVDSFLTYVETNEDVALVSLTGGEVGLLPGTIRHFVERAGRVGIRIGLMTSAFWAKTPAAAERFLDACGPVHLVTLSTDHYHLEFVPLSFIRNAYRACTARGIPTLVRLTIASEPSAGERELEALLRREVGDSLQVQHLVNWGRAADLGLAAPDEPGANVPTMPCPTTGPHIMEGGQVIPCCNSLTALEPTHDLVLGDLRQESYAEVWDRSKHDLLLLYIRLFGFHAIVAELQRLGFGITNTDISPCEVCTRIFADQEMSRAAAAWVRNPANALRVAARMFERHGEDFPLHRLTAQVPR